MLVMLRILQPIIYKQTTRGMTTTILPASVRISSDLAMGSQCLRNAAALRIVDNHLHTTNILPRTYREPTELASTMDKYCVGQAVTTFLQPSLLDLLHNPENQQKVRSHVWLAKVGNGSSLTFGSAVTLQNITLAMCSRVWVRVDATTKRPIKITEDERVSKQFCIGEDWEGKVRFGHAIPEINQISLFRDSNNNQRVDKQQLDMVAGKEVLTVQVGPQHMNHGEHVDHAFLADTASHALYLAHPSSRIDLLTNSDQSTLSMQYLAAGYLGQELNCRVTKDMSGNDIASIWGCLNDNKRSVQLISLAKWSKR